MNVCTKKIFSGYSFFIYPELYSLEVQNGPIIIRPVAFDKKSYFWTEKWQKATDDMENGKYKFLTR
ncbi:hypothetical protein P5F75_17180 [Caldifermentibacillus hisashii]|uniref:hypothetical protein n=1 Tax=Caldifermentibacillus hisashii TaxID=996558 RepID=UPI0017BC70CD|nr:hypothetical protein [Caldifermentibacillus hisashii]NWN98869.1 hypothetical protein [Bacillus sp. (in: firmicutes)]